MPHMPDTCGAFDLAAIVKRFPDTADTMLVDTRLTDEQEASCRVFRIYRTVPAHYHATCDEYLLVVSGRGTIFFGESDPFEVTPGHLVFFKKDTVHGLTIIEGVREMACALEAHAAMKEFFICPEFFHKGGEEALVKKMAKDGVVFEVT